MTRHINVTDDDLTKPDPPAELCDLIAEKVAEFEAELEAAKNRHPANAPADVKRRDTRHLRVVPTGGESDA